MNTLPDTNSSTEIGRVPWALLWSLVSGIALLGLGAFLNLYDYAASFFIIPLASCIVGSSTSLLVAHALGHGQINRINRILDHHVSRSAELQSQIEFQRHLPSCDLADPEVQRFARPWHIYRASRDQGQRIWIHDFVDFSNRSLAGPLVTVDQTSDGTTRTVQRILSGVVSSYRFLICANMITGGHGSTIYTFPMAGLDIDTSTVHAGHVLMRDWDGKQLLARALLTREPLEGIDTDGVSERRIPQESHEELDGIWDRLSNDTGSAVLHDL